MKRFYIIFILASFVFSSLFLIAQENRGEGGDRANAQGQNQSGENQTASSHSNRNRRKPISPRETGTAIEGFKGIRLGQNMDATLDALKENTIINLPKKYQDLDLESEETENFVQIDENKYFKSGYFLFKDDRLYAITLRFQDNQVDFLDLLTSLNEKYGKGSFMDANTVAWENGRTQMILERPATIKYMLMDVANDVRVNYTNNIVTNSVDITDGL